MKRTITTTFKPFSSEHISSLIAKYKKPRYRPSEDEQNTLETNATKQKRLSQSSANLQKLRRLNCSDFSNITTNFSSQGQHPDLSNLTGEEASVDLYQPESTNKVKDDSLKAEINNEYDSAPVKIIKNATTKIETSHQEGKFLVRNKVYRKVLSGPQILESSKDIIRNLKNPKDIFREKVDQKGKKVGDYDVKTCGEEKLGRYGKRFHILIDHCKSSNEQKNFDSMMKKVPLEYYRKYFERKKSKEQLKPSIPDQEKEIKRSNYNHKSLQKSSMSVILVSDNYPNESNSLPIQEQVRPVLESLNISEIKIKNQNEDKLALSKNSKRVPPTLKKDLRRTESWMKKSQDDTTSMKPKEKDLKKGNSSVWISQTNEIKDMLSSFSLENDSSIDLIRSKSKELKNELDMLETQMDEVLSVASDSSYKVDALKEIENKYGASQNVVFSMSKKRDFNVGKKANPEEFNFYRRLIYKEHKNANRIIMNSANNKPKGSQGGRNVFDPSHIK